MTEIDNVQLEQVIVHKVGNPSRGEQLKLSVNPLTLNDELVKSMLTKYFLGAFNENEHYHFTHLSDVGLNKIYNYVSSIFNDSKSFRQQSALLAQFLYSKSTHIKVKEGELYIASFKDVPFGNDFINAIGIFKSETKETFLKVFEHGESWEVIGEEGININKLDKGCLIFNSNKEEGYVVCIVDATNKQQDAQYWVKDFLQAEPYADSYHNTSKYMDMCRLFITSDYADKFEVNKTDQIDLLNRSAEYFKTKEQFSLQEFTEEIIHYPEIADSFVQFKKNYEVSRQFEMDDAFDINLSAVKKQAKVFKSVLKLDKNFHIYIHGRRDLVERGYDEISGKHYYKLYFEEES
jgi:37-kD nucleoid-associated bacterial protein